MNRASIHAAARVRFMARLSAPFSTTASAALVAVLLTGTAACGGGSAKQSPNQPAEPAAAEAPKVDQDKIISTIDFEDGKLEGSGFEVTDPNQPKPKPKKKEEAGEGTDDETEPAATEGGG